MSPRSTRCAAPTHILNWPAGSPATAAPITNCVAARFKRRLSQSRQERSRIACAIRLPLLLTNCSDLDLDGSRPLRPEAGADDSCHRFLLSQTASRTALDAV